VLIWGHLRFSRPALPRTGPPVSVAAILAFLWPLAVIMIFQGASRPLINLFVSRGADATQSLAVLTIVYALGHIHYGWVSEIRSLAPAFRDAAGSLYYIRRFVVACCAISFALAVLLFWTPIGELILLDLIGVEAGIARLCSGPLVIYSFFPFAVTLRGYYHGVGLVNRITDVMAWSGPCRLAAIATALGVLSMTNLPGATVGIAALLCGFTVEALTVSWGVRRRVATLSQPAT
jgi:progressive ankylosis protein